MDQGDHPVFVARLQGGEVACRTMDDAASVNLADRILANGLLAMSVDSSAEELQRLALVLMQYDRHEAAAALSNQARRLRAAAFLTQRLDVGRVK